MAIDSGELREHEAAFRAIVGEYGPTLARYVRRRIAHPSDADDVLQETLVAIWLGFPRLRDPSQPLGWLLHVARNRCRDYFRAHARRETSLEAAMLEAQANRFGLREHHQAERFAVIQDALDAAPADARDLARRFYLEGLTIAEIAADTHRPPGTVKRQLFQARHALRAALGVTCPPTQHRTEEKTAMPAQNTAEVPPVTFPLILPKIQIIETSELPFPIDCRELRSWPIVPCIGEKAASADYDGKASGWRCATVTTMQALRSTTVHEVEGVEIDIRTWRPDSGWQARTGTVVARLTDEKAEFLAVSLPQEEFTQIETFLDEYFAWNWGTLDRAIADAGVVRRDGDGSLVVADAGSIARGRGIPVGVVRLQIGDRSFRCLRVLEAFDLDDLTEGRNYLTESYLTEQGRTVLVRRYAPSHFAEAAQFPVTLDAADRRTIGGVTCLHWYDTLTDAAL